MRSLGIVLVLSVMTGVLRAEPESVDENKPLATRHHAWTFGLSGRYLELKAHPSLNLKTMMPTVGVGRAWVYDWWWHLLEIQLIVGPNNEDIREQSPRLDFSGSGFRYQLAHTLTFDSLRKPQGDFGFLYGIEYHEWNARSYQKYTDDEELTNENWVLRSRWLSFQPGIFWSHWKPARPQGNKPEWIMTRIESWVFSAGVNIALQSEISGSYVYNLEKTSINSRWQGTQFFFDWKVWFGI